MSPNNNDKAKRRSDKVQKGESGDDEEEEAARLLNEDPMDWMLKNEHVANMLSVRKSFQSASNVSARRLFYIRPVLIKNTLSKKT